MRTALALLVALLAPPSARAAELPQYWSVHVDIPADRAAFERVDRVDAETRTAFYDAHAIPEPAVWRVAAADGTYFTMRPRGASLADLAKPSTLTAEQSKELSGKIAPLSDAAHQTLREHHNEIWQLDTEFTTVQSISPRRHALLRIDTVSPAKVAAYNDAMKKIVGELAAEGVDIVAFYSAYGDGTARYIFLSDHPIRVKRVGKLARTRDVKLTSVTWSGRPVE